MLETDAKTKLCPFKLGNLQLHEDDESDRLCEGSACMGWDQWTDPVYETDKEGRRSIPSKFIRHDPKEPPQGHCGMIPPELNCGYP